MADQSDSETEEVEKWLGVFPTKQPQAVRQASLQMQPPLARHYTRLAGIPWDAHGYFHQRYSLFHKYDEGICMTDEAWFGVTPEPVACAVAQHMADAAPIDKSIIIDCFAGVGGNTIAFARSKRWTHIYAIEKDRDTIACAKQNAMIYGVAEKIIWIEADCFEVLDGALSQIGERAVIFASPPWGGPGYRSKQIFNLKGMEPYSLTDLLKRFRKVTHDVVLYLPRTSDLRQLAEENPSTRKIKVMHYCMEGASKALCAYFGDFIFPSKETWR